MDALYSINELFQNEPSQICEDTTSYYNSWTITTGSMLVNAPEQTERDPSTPTSLSVLLLIIIRALVI